MINVEVLGYPAVLKQHEAAMMEKASYVIKRKTDIESRRSH